MKIDQLIIYLTPIWIQLGTPTLILITQWNPCMIFLIKDQAALAVLVSSISRTRLDMPLLALPVMFQAMEDPRFDVSLRNWLLHQVL
jgi:hypothetical protein